MNPAVIVLFRYTLVLIFLGTLLGQFWLVPTFISESVTAFPEVDFLALPYALTVIAGIACLQISLFAVWRLLIMVEQNVIFTHAAFRWVDVIIWSAGIATMLVLLLGIHLLGVMQIGGMGLLLTTVGATVCGSGFVLLVIVMKGLLHGATTLETELAKTL